MTSHSDLRACASVAGEEASDVAGEAIDVAMAIAKAGGNARLLYLTTGLQSGGPAAGSSRKIYEPDGKPLGGVQVYSVTPTVSECKSKNVPQSGDA